MKTRDTIIRFIDKYGQKTGLNDRFFAKRIGVRPERICHWKKRLGQENEHNGKIPRKHWLEAWEKEAICCFYRDNGGDGYRRCAYMMIDQDIVYASPSAVYTVLSRAGVMRKWNRKVSKKGTGFHQPTYPHQQWHIDISFVKVQGVPYSLICILDGYSRAIVNWDLRMESKDVDVGIVMQGAKEKYPNESPQYISDNGKQFTGKEFRNFISNNDLSHVLTSPYYPQSNGKLERFHKSIKSECIRTQSPLTHEDAKRIISKYIGYYNNERLHSAIGYVTPYDKMLGNEEEIIKKREEKLKKRRIERLVLPSDIAHDILDEQAAS